MKKKLWNFFDWLVPTVKLNSSRWRDLWYQSEHRTLNHNFKIILLLGSVLYIIHYFLDKNAGLNSLEKFMVYRFGLSFLYFTSFTLMFNNSLKNSFAFKLPMLVCIFATSFFQARSMTWDPKVPYFFCIILPVVLVNFMRFTILPSLSLFGAIVWAEVMASKEMLLAEPSFLSACTLGAVFLIVLRSHIYKDIEAFLNNQEKIESQKRTIEVEKMLSAQSKAFLPKEICRRIENLLRSNSVTLLDAANQILKPQQKNIACLFSDIRGFTAATKYSLGEAPSGLIPNIGKCTEVVDEFNGVPRLVGDLIMAYFDEESLEINIRNAAKSALKMAMINSQYTRIDGTEFERYYILTAGEAVVGNIGGLGSSRDITIIGNPVNFAARIDAATKDGVFKSKLDGHRIILSESMAVLVMQLFREVELNKIDLTDCSYRFRDYQEQLAVWTLPNSERNQSIIFENRVSNFSLIHKIGFDNSIEEKVG